MGFGMAWNCMDGSPLSSLRACTFIDKISQEKEGTNKQNRSCCNPNGEEIFFFEGRYRCI